MIAEMMTTMTTNIWQGCEVWALSLMPLGVVVAEEERRRIVCVCLFGFREWMSYCKA